MMFWRIFRLELRVAFRHSAEIANPLWFFLIVITLLLFSSVFHAILLLIGSVLAFGAPLCLLHCHDIPHTLYGCAQIKPSDVSKALSGAAPDLNAGVLHIRPGNFLILRVWEIHNRVCTAEFLLVLFF